MKRQILFQQSCFNLLLLILIHPVMAENNATWHCHKNQNGLYICTGKTVEPIQSSLLETKVQHKNALNNQKIDLTPVEADIFDQLAQNSIFNPVKFNPKQALDQGIDWDRCQTQTQIQPINAQLTPDLSFVESDDAEYNRLDNSAYLSGNVEINQRGQRLIAEDVLYSIGDHSATLKKSIFYQNKAFRAIAETGEINLKTRQGTFHKVEYRIPTGRARGTAKTAELKGKGLATFENLTYSTCKPNQNDWVLSAGTLDIDQAEGVGIAHSAKLKFKGVPIFYTPYLSFPIDDRRKTGVLLPKIGHSSRRGFDFSLPYYFNLAPNDDLTLTPRILSRRGVMLGGEFRYLGEMNRFRLNGEVLPKDKVYQDGNQRRSAVSFHSSSYLTPDLTFNTVYNSLSDKDYLADMGSSLSAIATRHVEKRADLKYSTLDWSLLLRAQKFQTLNDAISAGDRPYSRLPQLLFLYDKMLGESGFDLSIESEYVRFAHSSEGKITGQRIDLHPRIAYTFEDTGYFITPALSGRYSQYRLINQTKGLDEKPDRLIGTFSLDSGLIFERPTEWFGTGLTQTIEPRLFYLYNSYEDQSLIPIFDSSEKDFRYDLLFSENRFNGTDRIGDANQLTLALQSRLITDQSGTEVLRLSLANIRYFADRRVFLTTAKNTFNTKETSSLVGDLFMRLNQHWNFNLGGEWNPYFDNKVQRSYAHLNYHNTDQYLFNLAYRQNRRLQNQNNDNSEQVDFSMKWAINQNYSFIARSLYALDNGTYLKNGRLADRDNLIEGIFGLQYQNCCWGTQFVVRDTLINENNRRDRSFYIQFELKGLGRIGHDINELIERNIYGFKYDE